MTNDLIVPRLKMPANVDIDADMWAILVDAIFPKAQSAASIVLAMKWCRKRGLDIMKRPVNIVPMWDSSLGRERETLWASIIEIEITAARTKEWAGMDEPRWGPDVTESFHARGKRDGREYTFEVTYPEYCIVTVYRMVEGQRCPFSEPVYWKEAYGRIGGGNTPNEMWRKRPRGQLQKVAKAASLRSAFPEEGDYSAEEMEDQILDTPPIVQPADKWRPPAQTARDNVSHELIAHAAETLPPYERNAPPKDPHDAGDVINPDTGEVTAIGPREIKRGDEEAWPQWGRRLLDYIEAETTMAAVDEWLKKNEEALLAMDADAPKVHIRFAAAIKKHRQKILSPPAETPPNEQEAPPQ
ncbi:MAG: recombinase [Acidobacteria bacterium]|nr:MAG: recombinase [Acidobacteriota bacterium]